MLRRPTPAPDIDFPGRAGVVELESALVLRARAGDRDAETSLYRMHVTSVHALASRLLGRSEDAEDVVQDAFVTALGRLHQLRDAKLFRPWLMRITVREVHRRFRRRRLL